MVRRADSAPRVKRRHGEGAEQRASNKADFDIGNYSIAL